MAGVILQLGYSTPHLGALETPTHARIVIAPHISNAGSEDEFRDNLPILFRGRQLLDLLSYADIIDLPESGQSMSLKTL
jgi:hypothetical protein